MAEDTLVELLQVAQVYARAGNNALAHDTLRNTRELAGPYLLTRIEALFTLRGDDLARGIDDVLVSMTMETGGDAPSVAG